MSKWAQPPLSKVTTTVIHITVFKITVKRSIERAHLLFCDRHNLKQGDGKYRRALDWGERFQNFILKFYKLSHNKYTIIQKSHVTLYPNYSSTARRRGVYTTLMVLVLYLLWRHQHTLALPLGNLKVKSNASSSRSLMHGLKTSEQQIFYDWIYFLQR